MCDHCDVLDKVLMDLTGRNVADVIMRRVKKKLHPENTLKVGKGELAPVIPVNSDGPNQ